MYLSLFKTTERRRTIITLPFASFADNPHLGIFYLKKLVLERRQCGRKWEKDLVVGVVLVHEDFFLPAGGSPLDS